MNDAYKSILDRRSVRSYKTQQLAPETLDAIIKAGLHAPSAMNRQPTKLLVIQDKAVIAELSKLNAGVMGRDIDPFYAAPTVVVVLADKTVPTYIEDGSLVMGNLMNAAAALGVASCWINRAREVFDTEYGRKLLQANGISDNYVGIANCILGYRDGELPKAPEIAHDRVYNIK